MSAVDNILAQIELVSMLPADCKLKSVGRDSFRGNCPIERHKSVFTFSVKRHPAGHQVFACYACNLRGSVIDLIAALDHTTVRQAIKKLSGNNLPELSRDAILQRVEDQVKRMYPEFGYIACTIPGCSTVAELKNELDFVILCSGSSWLWKVSPNGRHAICYKHKEYK